MFITGLTWSINNKLSGCGRPQLCNAKGIHHYSWQLLIGRPLGQSLQITPLQLHLFGASSVWGLWQEAVMTTDVEALKTSGQMRMRSHTGVHSRGLLHIFARIHFYTDLISHQWKRWILKLENMINWRQTTVFKDLLKFRLSWRYRKIGTLTPTNHKT